MLDAISTPDAPAPNGHYVQGVKASGLIFTSVQLPGGADESQEALSYKDQARRALQNVLNIVEAGGGRRDTVVQLTLYATDMGAWPDVDEACAQVFGPHKPARGVVSVPALHLGYAVAAQAVALRAGE